MMLVSLTLLAGCSEESVSTDNSSGMNEADIRMIAGELAIQKGISLLCDREATDQLSEFMEDLRYEGLARELREDVAADSVVLMHKISAEEPEYICTPEMFESADLRVSQALLAWDEMRGITQ
ncbi:hypothetical protein MGWOODY_Hyp1028 [hydrothermal vent metagenome]|uniref:Uncharacterized protein n=2 Tax=root TaxID=1 RepID=A0A160TX90_9ZZZZ